MKRKKLHNHIIFECQSLSRRIRLFCLEPERALQDPDPLDKQSLKIYNSDSRQYYPERQEYNRPKKPRAMDVLKIYKQITCFVNINL